MQTPIRTLEIIYWGIALLVLFVIFLSANIIATNWLNSEHFSETELMNAIWIIGAVIAARLPIALYTGGFNGLQLQVKLNIIITVFATLQGAGALLFYCLLIQEYILFLCGS